MFSVMKLAQAPQVRVSYGASAPAWAFDLHAVERAVQALALARPGEIAMTNGRGGRARLGVHRYQGDRHVITVHRRSTRESASETLWHELEHARQLEHDFAGDVQAFGHAYRANRAFYERQAEDREREHALHPLT